MKEKKRNLKSWKRRGGRRNAEKNGGRLKKRNKHVRRRKSKDVDKEDGGEQEAKNQYEKRGILQV